VAAFAADLAAHGGSAQTVAEGDGGKGAATHSPSPPIAALWLSLKNRFRRAWALDDPAGREEKSRPSMPPMTRTLLTRTNGSSRIVCHRSLPAS
jgi:hypothetical protein